MTRALLPRFVLTHPELGTYIGSCMGMGFWSALDSAGQTEAVTFPTESAALDHGKRHNPPGLDATGYHAHQILLPMHRLEADGSLYVRVDELVTAGLPSWNPEAADPTAGASA